MTRVVLDTYVLVAAELAAGAVLVTNDAHLLAVAGHNGRPCAPPGPGD